MGRFVFVSDGSGSFRVGRTVHLFLVALLSAISLAPVLHSQALTGYVSGRVFDSSGKLVPGARVSLINSSTQQSRTTQTSPTGDFVFPEVLPGSFGLQVESPGFKKFEQRGIVVAPSDHLVLNAITLVLGQFNETVMVEGAADTLETQSSDRSGLVDSHQLQELSLKGRDYMGTLRLLPGILDTASATREAPGNRALIGLYVNGNRQGTLNMALDGISLLSLGGGTGPFIEPAIDAVAEVNVLQTNYPAEYGRSVGGTINTVTKSGSRDFHGGAYYYFRNTDLNANDFFANSQGLPRSTYQYNNPGYYVGGPVIFPKSDFNRNRDKLFFFWSEEFLIRTVPSSVSYQTFPTALERQGNFSQSLDQNGQLITIRDPISNSPFPGNIVPASRISPQGQALLNLFPLPNTSVATRAYNSVFQVGIQQPRNDQVLRVDWNIGAGTTFYVRGIKDNQAQRGGFGFVLASLLWPQLPVNYEIPCQGIVGTLIHTFSPTKINELTFGVNRGAQNEGPLTQAGLTANSRSNLSAPIPQFFPSANLLGVVPNATFGGIPDAPQLFIDSRFPYFGRNNVWTWMDNYSQVSGQHNLKFGVYIERSAVNEVIGSAFNGTFAFDRDPNNPTDTGYAFSNALIGSVDSYTEANNLPVGHVRDNRVEWYAQDNWKVNRRFTIDMGVRFYWLDPAYNAENSTATFNPSAYSYAQQPPLIQPYVDPVTGVREGRDPITGQILPAVKIGTFSGAAGTPYQGMTVFKPGAPIMQMPPIQVTPRFGFAWDVFGTGKTAVRSGFGMYNDRFPDDQIAQLTAVPPLTNTSSANYTTIANLLSTPLSLSPNAVYGLDGHWKPLAVYNWSFGVQQSLPSDVRLDVAYVGNVSRHGMQIRDLNATGYGTNFLASSKDPTLAGNLPLPANFLRPYVGFSNIQYMEFGSNSNYNALQAQLSKRFSSSFTFNLAYTWSKVLDVADTGTSAVNPVIDFNSRNYGPAAFDRRQNLAINFVYALPALGKRWNNAISRQTLSGWEVSGIASFINGAPTAINYTFVTATDVTGASGIGVDSRVDLSCNPNLALGDKSFSRALNTSCVHPPTVGELGIGNASKYPFVGPGVNNFDLSLFKNFRIGKSEAQRMQIRLETYNAFNHAQFTALDNNARFDSRGNQVNQAFGSYTAAAPSRRVALGVKLYF
jgi:hypothetical protein